MKTCLFMSPSFSRDSCPIRWLLQWKHPDRVWIRLGLVHGARRLAEGRGHDPTKIRLRVSVWSVWEGLNVRPDLLPCYQLINCPLDSWIQLIVWSIFSLWSSCMAQSVIGKSFSQRPVSVNDIYCFVECQYNSLAENQCLWFPHTFPHGVLLSDACQSVTWD